jgi:hypothetical protein
MWQLWKWQNLNRGREDIEFWKMQSGKLRTSLGIERSASKRSETIKDCTTNQYL